MDILCAAVADGRLTLAELQERVGAALSARTLTDLAMLIADLDPDGLHLAGERAATPQRPQQRRDRDIAARRWALIQSLVAASS